MLMWMWIFVYLRSGHYLVYLGCLLPLPDNDWQLAIKSLLPIVLDSVNCALSVFVQEGSSAVFYCFVDERFCERRKNGQCRLCFRLFVQLRVASYCNLILTRPFPAFTRLFNVRPLR